MNEEYFMNAYDDEMEMNKSSDEDVTEEYLFMLALEIKKYSGNCVRWFCNKPRGSFFCRKCPRYSIGINLDTPMLKKNESALRNTNLWLLAHGYLSTEEALSL